MKVPGKTLLRRIGRAYIIYHTAIIGILILAGMPLGQLKWENLLELAFIFCIYPALIPAIFVCGSLHARNCDDTLFGMLVQATFLLAGAAWYLIGGWTFAHLVIRLVRFIRNEGNDSHHG